MRIGEYFRAKGKISESVLKAALKIQQITGQRLGRVLVELGAISQDDLVEYLSMHNPEALVEEKTVYSTISPDLLKRKKAFVLSESRDTIFVAALDPSIKEDLESTLSKKVVFEPIDLEFLLTKVKRNGEIAELVNLSNPNELLLYLVKEAVDRNASDIHIELIGRTTAVRYRLDGILHLVHVFPKSSGETLIARIKGMANMDMAEKNYPQDGALVLPITKTKEIYIRVSTMPAVLGETAVLRILDRDRVLLTLDSLGIKRLSDWKKAVASRDGVILVTGATGTGKSTTLYTTLLYLDRLGRNIVTVEDPVEYQFPFIRQVQVNELLNLNFATFLKHALRQDPDVILVGEVRDEETARIMMQAAETGHLVFATLHAGTIPSAFARLRDLGVRDVDLKYLLRCILSQALLRRVCKNCDGKGCGMCDYTGYRGRVLVSELVLFDEETVKRFLEGDIPVYESLLDNALELLAKGVTDEKEIERAFGVRPTDTMIDTDGRVIPLEVL